MGEKKIISVSSRRQITIPQEFSKKLGIKDEVECILKNGEIIIRPPVKDYISKEILDILREKGLEGDMLEQEYQRVSRELQNKIGKDIREIIQQKTK